MQKFTSSKRALSSFVLATLFVASSPVAVHTRAQATKPAQVAATPDIARLRKHVAYLASDELTGRRTGTTGARLAADYIAAEFARLGLKPTNPAGYLASGNSTSRENSGAALYLQNFPYTAGVEPGKGNRMLFASRATGEPNAGRAAALDLRINEDFAPLGFSTNATLENTSASFVGFGITDAENKIDDYAGVNVRDRIVVMFAATPDGDSPHGKFARFVDLRLRAARAREQGARAVVFIARTEDFKADRLTRIERTEQTGDAGLPAVIISRQAARRIVESNGVNLPLDELEKALRQAATNTATIANTSSVASSVPAKNLSVDLTSTLSITTDLIRRTLPAANVVGVLEGTDAVLKSETIVIGAHYDHLGDDFHPGSLANINATNVTTPNAKTARIHHGADDNASGVAAMLELARIFTVNRPRRTTIFAAFSGEEEGLLGSSYFINNPPVPAANIVAMLNMDMVGRLRDDKLLIGGVGTGTEFRKVIETANTNVVNVAASKETDAKTALIPSQGTFSIEAKQTSLQSPQFALTLNDDGFGPSDHSSFYAKQIPVLFFFTGTHDDYHKPSDTFDKINYDGEARIVSFIAKITTAIDRAPQRPTYAVTQGNANRTMGFRVYLGTIPNYGESKDGLLLEGVRAGSPAEKAGLKPNDRIVKLAGRDVRDVYDYTNALAEMKPEETYDVEVIRAGERLNLKLTPTARK